MKFFSLLSLLLFIDFAHLVSSNEERGLTGVACIILYFPVSSIHWRNIQAAQPAILNHKIILISIAIHIAK